MEEIEIRLATNNELPELFKKLCSEYSRCYPTLREFDKELYYRIHCIDEGFEDVLLGPFDLLKVEKCLPGRIPGSDIKKIRIVVAVLGESIIGALAYKCDDSKSFIPTASINRIWIDKEYEDNDIKQKFVSKLCGVKVPVHWVNLSGVYLEQLANEKDG